MIIEPPRLPRLGNGLIIERHDIAGDPHGIDAGPSAAASSGREAKPKRPVSEQAADAAGSDRARRLVNPGAR